jgi:CheY-like chemotaxis protein
MNRTILLVEDNADNRMIYRTKAEEVGCDGYLAKPIEPRRVLEEGKGLLSSASSVEGRK